MYRLRIISASILIPISVIFAYFGGPLYVLYVLLIMGLAASEYVDVLRKGGFRPSRILVVGAAMLFIVGAYLTTRAPVLIEQMTGTRPALPGWPEWVLGTSVALLLAAMAWHVFDHERGATLTASDWSFTLTGGLYLGIFAAHYVLMREDLGADGRWWVLIILPAQWIADSAALVGGRRFGRHKLVPRLSPGKTWEGYVCGVVAALVAGALLGTLSSVVAPLAGDSTRVNWLVGMVGAGLCAGLSVIGDLGESMLKRQVKVKDSSNLVPGHGGMLDRTDSQLWSVVIGYYFFKALIAIWPP